MKHPSFNPRNLLLPVLVSAGIAFLYFNVFSKLGYDWWNDENYSHGLLVPFVIAYMLYESSDELRSAAGRPALAVGAALIFTALVMLLFGTLGAELFMQRISLVVMLAGVVVYFFGTRILRPLAVPFVLLILSIPIPQILFNKVAFPLQIWASQLAVWAIRTSGIAALRKGNIIEILPMGSVQVIALEVVEACSGIRSLMTLMALALILVYFTSRRFKHPRSLLGYIENFDLWRAIALMVLAVPIAVFTNAGRVALTGIFSYYYGKKATESFLHSSAGWIVFLIAFVLLLLINFGLLAVRGRFERSDG